MSQDAAGAGNRGAAVLLSALCSTTRPARALPVPSPCPAHALPEASSSLFPVISDYSWVALTVCKECEKPPTGISPLFSFPASLTVVLKLGIPCVLITPREWLSCGFTCSSFSSQSPAATRGTQGQVAPVHSGAQKSV